MKILLLLRYDGSAFCGFQTQPNGVSVQGTLTEAFERLLGFPCDITGCSRTDSGVHALGFCATLAPRGTVDPGEAWCPIPVGRLHRAINPLLPNALAVMAAATVPDSLHAWYSVLSKAYEYRIYDAPARDPFLAGRVCRVPQRILPDGEDRMRRAAAACGAVKSLSRWNMERLVSGGTGMTSPCRRRCRELIR